MRILVLGGTGAIGLLLIQEALTASHIVVVYARSPEKLPESISLHQNVVIVKGELNDSEALDSALEGVHAVISALGPAVKAGPLHPSGTPIAKGYKLVIELMHKHGIKRIVALGTASNKDDHDKFDLTFRTLVGGVALFAHNAYKDVVEIGNTIRGDEELVWTLARVPILTSSDHREYHAGYIGDGRTKAYLPRLAYAAFVVEELEQNQWARKAPMISN